MPLRSWLSRGRQAGVSSSADRSRERMRRSTWNPVRSSWSLEKAKRRWRNCSPRCATARTERTLHGDPRSLVSPISMSPDTSVRTRRARRSRISTRNHGPRAMRSIFIGMSKPGVRITNRVRSTSSRHAAARINAVGAATRFTVRLTVAAIRSRSSMNSSSCSRSTRQTSPGSLTTSSPSITSGSANTPVRCAVAICTFPLNASRGPTGSTKRCWICSQSLAVSVSGSDPNQVHSAIEQTRARKIQSGMFLMWGYEGEEMEDIEATIQHVSKSKPDIFFTTVSYPIKGTPYYQQVQNKLVQLGPWGKSSDREIKISGRHSRAYYAHADKLLRAEVQLAKLKDCGEQDLAVINDLAQSITASRQGLLATQNEVEA